MVALQPFYDSLLKSLPPSPIHLEKLNGNVERTLTAAKDKTSPDNRKIQWEYLLRNDIFALASAEGNALQQEGTKYYDELRDKLDLALAFTEHDACEPTFPLLILQELLETQTIASCSHIFSWIESHAARLTEGMVPQKGKALILLRTLNDLLRRLSKMGTTTIFCGRILTFLSGVFPLGERSGVNLRGEYGPTWEGVRFARHRSEEKDDMKVDEGPVCKIKEEVAASEDKMEVDAKKLQTPGEQKEDFYNTFWSLQLPFSKPPVFANKGAFEEFQGAVDKVMPVIKEATAKERAMMGSRGGPSPAILKRKREPGEETNSNEYFFAKFLTSPDLLDLEIADTHFRRQFLFQLLILLNHLNSFTKAAKPTWSTPRNRSLQMDFTLEDADAQWVHDALNKVVEELRQTTPNGRIFADTVSAVLEREKNWVKWKNELCTPFDKEPWEVEVEGRKVGLAEATKPARDKMREAPPDWKWRLGTEPLTEIWEMGYTSLHDLQNPFQPGDVKDFVKKIKLEDGRIALRKRRLEQMARTRATPLVPKVPTAHSIPTIVVSTESEVTSKTETNTRPESTLATPTVRSVGGTNGSPLHPSLPPKPGTPSKLAPLSQESLKPASPAPPIVAPAPIAAQAPTLPATPAPPPVLLVVDEEIAKYEENKQRWAWLALRTARDQHLQHFGKIGTGDVELLAQEIEKSLKGEDISSMTAEEHGSGSPSSGTTLGTESREGEGDVDVKMDG